MLNILMNSLKQFILQHDDNTECRNDWTIMRDGTHPESAPRYKVSACTYQSVETNINKLLKLTKGLRVKQFQNCFSTDEDEDGLLDMNVYLI